MKQIFIALAGNKFSEKHIAGFGTQISSEFGHISVVSGGKFSPAKHSVSDFVIKEEHRGQGHGDELVREVIRRYRHDIGAQCSSKASVHLFFKHGFRMPDEPHHNLVDAFRVMEEYSSVYLKLD